MNYDPQNIEDGIYTDMPIDVYHENKTHYSASSIKEIYKSLAHFKAYLEKEAERKVHLDFGNAFELSISDTKEFESKCAIFNPSDRPEPKKTFASNKNKEWKEKFYKDNEDKLIIPSHGADSLDVLTICKQSLYNHKAAVSLLKNCEYQTSLFWTDPTTAVKLKTRPDFWKPSTNKRSSIVNDLKTDKDTETDNHYKNLFSRNYPVQACLQLMGLKHFNLIDETARYFWIVIGKNVPYNTEVYEFDTSDIEQFTESLKYKLEELSRALKTNTFLSYDPNKFMGIKTVEFPYWYKIKMGIVEYLN